MREMIGKFSVRGEPVWCQRFGCGHINETYMCTCDSGLSYILQKINRGIFADPPALMRNIAAVTEYLAARADDRRAAMRVVPARDGEKYVVDAEGEYWRMYEFVPSSVCLQAAQRPEDFRNSGLAFGRFLNQLAEFPVASLHETVARFHDTPHRYAQFDDALRRDPKGRSKRCAEEIALVRAWEPEAGTIVDALRTGEIPVRVTHNDTKLNNVLLDYDSGEPLCVIDLDTVMPGSALYDYGDSIRFGASTAAEDETDLGKVEMDLNLFRCFTEGYLEGCGGSLTPRELELLPMGAKLMTLECGVRFLTDYLNGDVYFRTHRPEQNLDRARTQFKLVRDMEAKWDRMSEIICEISNRRRGS